MSPRTTSQSDVSPKDGFSDMRKATCSLRAHVAVLQGPWRLTSRLDLRHWLHYTEQRWYRNGNPAKVFDRARHHHSIQPKSGSCPPLIGC
jgi:hypothetical protein